MSRYKLIPLNGEFLLIDTQADIVENDYAYEHLIIEADPSNDKKIAINKKAVRQCKWVGNGLIGFTDGDTTGLGWCKKVIASAYIPELPIISKSAIISLYESEHAHELAVKYSLDVENFIGNTGGQYNHCIADFIAGYSANTAKYTEEDLRKAYRQCSFDSNAMARTMHNKENEYLQSLLPATVTERFCEIEWINDGYAIKILKLN